MAGNAYLNFMGKADGESLASGKEKLVDVASWSWQVEAETSWTKGGGAAVGKPNPGALTFTHRFDAASPALLGHITNGTAFDKVVLTITATTAAPTPEPAFTATLDGVFVTAVRTSYDGDQLMQEVDVVFKAVKIDYRPLDPAKGTLAPVKTFSWDIPAGKVTAPLN